MRRQVRLFRSFWLHHRKEKDGRTPKRQDVYGRERERERESRTSNESLELDDGLEALRASCTVNSKFRESLSHS